MDSVTYSVQLVSIAYSLKATSLEQLLLWEGEQNVLLKMRMGEETLIALVQPTGQPAVMSSQ